MIKDNKTNPFQKLSELFVNNQNSLNKDVQMLRTSLRTVKQILDSLIEELESDPFSANLTTLCGLDSVALQILEQGRSLEETRDKILDSVTLLEKSNEKKLRR
tara:strand:- start:1537 stop:1845 length:309 start_codon:yes stop_codon:yes gene_type:complete